MQNDQVLKFVEKVIDNHPKDWLKLTTHRLDIYVEEQAKSQFLEHFEALVEKGDASTSALSELPTAYDYIRLGHPLSSVLEWAIAKLHGLPAAQVIAFSSVTAPVLAVLRKNLLQNTKTRIAYKQLPALFDAEVLRTVYGYQFELEQVNSAEDLSAFSGSTIFFSDEDKLSELNLHGGVDFHIQHLKNLGSIILVNDEQASYVAEIQHVRRRETIAMTPADTLVALQMLVGVAVPQKAFDISGDKAKVEAAIRTITGTDATPLVGSSGLSVQYAIVMGLIHDAIEKHPGKAIKIVVPPNCYGGTNDQARRVAACLENVEVMDMPVDGGNNMVQSVEMVLDQIAAADAVPYIIAEIPTNPRVEVPDLMALKAALSKVRHTASGEVAVDPVFILDQTFCPNVNFLGGSDAVFAPVRAIAYVSGSKFPSGGKVTAGYCVANAKSAALLDKIKLHLQLCDNEATSLQMEILAKQLPSMNQRIADAYRNTRLFVSFIQEKLPEAKINFVSEKLAEEGFTPSVFSLDLPTKGNTDEEREAYKRALNLQLITMMIEQIPDQSKYCVSYGQLKGCYWTIPATSTQGTTKEGDKDYIARVALSPDMDLEKHKAVFEAFVENL